MKSEGKIGTEGEKNTRRFLRPQATPSDALVLSQHFLEAQKKGRGEKGNLDSEVTVADAGPLICTKPPATRTDKVHTPPEYASHIFPPRQARNCTKKKKKEARVSNIPCVFASPVSYFPSSVASRNKTERGPEVSLRSIIISFTSGRMERKEEGGDRTRVTLCLCSVVSPLPGQEKRKKA